jgi:hypothetical protein
MAHAIFTHQITVDQGSEHYLEFFSQKVTGNAEKGDQVMTDLKCGHCNQTTGQKNSEVSLWF